MNVVILEDAAEDLEWEVQNSMNRARRLAQPSDSAKTNLASDLAFAFVDRLRSSNHLVSVKAFCRHLL